ncbi:MAG: hypothetical protein SNJ29_15245 [Rikenellaceae bacterium]
MAINDNRIIEIEGVSFLVDDSTYDYYWGTRRISETSESHIIACRRILGLGPNDSKLEYNKIPYEVWGDLKDKEHLFSLLAESDIVTFVEPDYLHLTSNNKISGAAKAIETEKQIEVNDPEFEPDLEL